MSVMSVFNVKLANTLLSVLQLWKHEAA